MPNYLCQVKVTNNVEGAVIDQLVCQFYYTDGAPVYVHDKDVNIVFQGVGYNDSNTNDHPTKRVTTVAKVLYGGQTVAVTHDSGDAPAGGCHILVPIELNANRLLAIAKLAKDKSPAEVHSARLTLTEGR